MSILNRKHYKMLFWRYNLVTDFLGGGDFKAPGKAVSGRPEKILKPPTSLTKYEPQMG